MKMDTGKLTRLSMLSALAIVLMLLIRFPLLPSAAFLEYEPADIAILISAFMFGPISGLIVAIIVSFVQFLTVSAVSGWVGLVMHIIASGSLAIVAGTIYKKFRSHKGAAFALFFGVLTMTALMIPSNLFFTVKYWGMPYELVKNLLLPAIIPFNLLKGVINSILVLLIYKPLKGFLENVGGKRCG